MAGCVRPDAKAAANTSARAQREAEEEERKRREKEIRDEGQWATRSALLLC